MTALLHQAGWTALDQQLRMAERSGIATLIPGDAHCPRALNDLGERVQHALFVQGTTSFLTRPSNDLVTVTGSQAASTYGEQVGTELAGNFANRESVLTAVGAYGVEAAVHRAALAANGDTIAALAGGVDRPHPSGNRDLIDWVGDVSAPASELPLGSVLARHRFLARPTLAKAYTPSSLPYSMLRPSGGYLDSTEQPDRHPVRPAAL